MVAPKKFYAVRVGRKKGIYTQWFGPQGAQAQVTGFRGAQFKGFATRAEAEDFLNTQTESESLQPKQADDRIQIYTDGGAVGNPGPGGFGVVILHPDGQRQEICGGFRRTTNNRMELMGCIQALEAVNKGIPVTVHSDSRYLVDAVNKGWVRNWQRRGWKKADGTPALNIDLWQRLLPLLETSDIRLQWVKGHAGNVWNERCDQLVHEAVAKGPLTVDEGYENPSVKD
jgi:ribonuclease HI